MDITITTTCRAGPRLRDYGPIFDTTASRRPSLKGRNTFRGQLAHEGRAIIYESLLERDAATVLLADRRVALLEDQPAAVEYRDATGRLHRHTFDFRVTLQNGRKVAVIVKPASKANRPSFRELVANLKRDTPPTFAGAVIVVTDADLHPARVADAALFLSARLIDDPTADAAVMQVIDDLNGSVSIATLRDLAGFGGRGFGAAIRAIDRGRLEVVDRHSKRPLSLSPTRADGRIDQFTLVTPSKTQKDAL